MTNLEMMKLPEHTKVRINHTVECDESYKKICLLTWYNDKKRGYTEINEDTGELEVNYPFGIETPTGVCYQFPADNYELAYFKN